MMEFLTTFRRHAETDPGKTAVYDERVSLTYGQLDAASDLIAQQLRHQNLGPGSTVAYLGGIGAGRVASYLGALKAGVTFFVLDERNPAAVNQDLVDHAGAAAVLAETERYAGLAAELTQTVLMLPPLGDPAALDRLAVPAGPLIAVQDTEAALIRYTSGTSGQPKGIPVERRSEQKYIEMMVELWNLTSADILAVFGPFWPPQVGGTLFAGGTIAVYDFAVRGPAAICEWLRAEKVTFTSTYTAIFRAMPVEQQEKLPDLRLFRAMGEPLYRADAERFENIAVPGTIFANGYGSNEFAFIAAYNHRVGDPVTFDAMPIGPLSVPQWTSIVGADGMAVPPGEVGEIVIHCPFGPTRYLNDPDRSAQVFRPCTAAGGEIAYYTGDQGYLDENAALQLVGRVDDQTKIRGYTVRPSDAEASLRQIAGIAQVAVVPHDGPKGIRQLVCHFVLAPGAALGAAEIKARLGDVLPGYLVPSHFVQHAALPVTSSGKVLRRALPRPDASRNHAAARAAVTGTERQIASIWQDTFGHGEFGTEDDFFDIGGDSLQAMTLILAIEAGLGVRIPLETLILRGATILDLAAIVDMGGPAIRPLTALGRGGPLSALYAMPVIGGHLSDYLALAHTLDGAHPVRGLSYAGVEGLAAAGSIPALARHSADILIGEGQASNAVLLGYSFGGIVAYELAQQLTERGYPPAALCLIDADNPWADPLPWLRSAWRAARRGHLGASGRRLGELFKAQLDRPASPASVDEAHLVAMLRYRPAPARLRNALLIVAEKRDHASAMIDAWQRLAGDPLEVRRAQGTHFSMMRTPNVEGLGRTIKAWLAAVAETETQSRSRSDWIG